MTARRALGLAAVLVVLGALSHGWRQPVTFVAAGAAIYIGLALWAVEAATGDDDEYVH